MFPLRKSVGSIGARAAALCFLLASCSTLPSSGPTGAEIDDAATSADNTIGYKIIDITPQTLQAMSTALPVSLHAIWGDQKPDSVTRIGIGDVLSITIFTVGGEAPAPTSGGDSGIPGIHSQALPPIAVGESGRITVPYAGQIDVVGKTPTEVEQLVNRALTKTQFQPQAVVGVTRDLSNTVLLTGDVHAPGRQSLLIAGEKIQDIIARAGGPTHAPQDTIVRLHRNGRTAETWLREIIDTPLDDISMQPGDELELVYEPRTFLSFGASGRVSQVPFDLPTLTLGEAIAKIGGPLDQQADPSAIYLFRFERPDVARRLGIVKSGQRTPVIYRVNMMDPQSYFVMQQFSMRDKDLVYIANARSNQFQKFLVIVNAMFNSIFEPVYTIKSVAP